ncbi:hypothetical protein FHG87_001792 [Trinorchestia longiramus]|nr:hypothetical protein FHG87_001792 [Trinorchestia longiramus]
MVGPDGAVTCCRKARDDASSVDHLCFELLSDGSGNDAAQTPMHPYSCLPARAALSRSPLSCRDTSECPYEHYCLAPSVGTDERLLRIARTSVAEIRSGFSLSKETKVSLGQRRLSTVNYQINDNSEVVNTNNFTRTSLGEFNQLSASKIEPLPMSMRKLSTVKKDKIQPDLHLRLSEQQEAANEDEDYKRETDDGHSDDVEALSSFNEVLYLGSPALLYQTVAVTDYMPKKAFISYGWIEELQELCLCFVKFSGALALLNLIPCVGFDGQHISDTLVDWYYGDSFSRYQSKLLKSFVTAVGTILVSVNILVGLLSLSFTDAHKAS